MFTLTKSFKTIKTVSYFFQPAVASLCRGDLDFVLGVEGAVLEEVLPAFYFDEDNAVFSSDEDDAVFSSDDAVFSSDEDDAVFFSDEDDAVFSSDEDDACELEVGAAFIPLDRWYNRVSEPLPLC
ncbi:hypothetical protein WMY93_003910 [Mugilogobius chulae]|uniref:Uncharacterized protein n=1 Tax=Mugilogobius chulae TaxID=88201 RepID=A0AAW0Q0U6_9GOBI